MVRTDTAGQGAWVSWLPLVCFPFVATVLWIRPEMMAARHAGLVGSVVLVGIVATSLFLRARVAGRAVPWLLLVAGAALPWAAGLWRLGVSTATFESLGRSGVGMMAYPMLAARGLGESLEIPAVSTIASALLFAALCLAAARDPRGQAARDRHASAILTGWLAVTATLSAATLMVSSSLLEGGEPPFLRGALLRAAEYAAALWWTRCFVGVTATLALAVFALRALRAAPLTARRLLVTFLPLVVGIAVVLGSATSVRRCERRIEKTASASLPWRTAGDFEPVQIEADPAEPFATFLSGDGDHGVVVVARERVQLVTPIWKRDREPEVLRDEALRFGATDRTLEAIFRVPVERYRAYRATLGRQPDDALRVRGVRIDRSAGVKVALDRRLPRAALVGVLDAASRAGARSLLLTGISTDSHTGRDLARIRAALPLAASFAQVAVTVPVFLESALGPEPVAIDPSFLHGTLGGAGPMRLPPQAGAEHGGSGADRSDGREPAVLYLTVAEAADAGSTLRSLGELRRLCMGRRVVPVLLTSERLQAPTGARTGSPGP